MTDPSSLTESINQIVEHADWIRRNHINMLSGANNADDIRDEIQLLETALAKLKNELNKLAPPIKDENKP